MISVLKEKVKRRCLSWNQESGKSREDLNLKIGLLDKQL
jgi:hypothetical protein